MHDRLVSDILAFQAKHPKVRLVLPYVGPMEARALRWLTPDAAAKDKFDELADVAGELVDYLPIGKVERECVLVDTKAPHPVAVYMEQLWPLAPSLAAFFETVVLHPGDKTPMQRLTAAVKQGRKLEKAEKPGEAAALVEPLLAPFAQDPDPARENTEDHEEHVADAWNSLGVFRESAGDLTGARAAYLHAAWWGLPLGAANYCDTCSNATDVAAAVVFLGTFIDLNKGALSHEEEADLRARLVAWQLGAGATADGEKGAVAWLERFSVAARKDLWPAQRKVLLARFAKQRIQAYDAARLDALAAPYLRAMKK